MDLLNGCFLVNLQKERTMKIWKTLLIIALFIGVACETDDSNLVDDTQDISFDRGAMLVHWADNFIIPSYTDFSVKVSGLDESIITFNTAPSLEGLQSVRENWLVAYRSFQKVSMFEIGKAETLNYRNRLNVYPANASGIHELITAGVWNFDLPSTIDEQGFSALDYLLNGLGSDEETVAFYTTNPESENAKNYLKALSATIKSLTNEVLNDWNTSFRAIYVVNTSSSATGAVDQTVNAFMFYYEKALRAGKVGIPAGVFSTNPLPQNVEGFFKENESKLLLQDALSATRNFFNGFGIQAGPGLKAYLDTLNSVKNGSDLSTLINNQFDASETKINALSANFSEQVLQDNSKMLSTYDELQRNVILLKVDMLQALGIDINYVDADGD
ncbi:MAG: hypothetical protein ACI825_000496 [Planctomycetota bacterium]